MRPWIGGKDSSGKGTRRRVLIGGFGARPSGVVLGVSGMSISPSNAAPSSDVGDAGAGAGVGAGGGLDAVADVDAIWPCLRLSPAAGS